MHQGVNHQLVSQSSNTTSNFATLQAQSQNNRYANTIEYTDANIFQDPVTSTAQVNENSPQPKTRGDTDHNIEMSASQIDNRDRSLPPLRHQ